MKISSKMKKLLIGLLSFTFMIAGVFWVNTTSKAEDIQCKHYDDISQFRGENPIAPPADTGYIFAGWYREYNETTKKFSNPLSKSDTAPENGAYAKFVPDYILSTKAQVSVNVINDDITGDTPAAIRLVTSIDSLDYDSVGFVITRADKPEYKHDKSANTVSKTMYYVGKADGDKMSVTPASVFGPSAEYFRAFTFTNMPESAVDTEITAMPYYITLDGTRVEGTQGVKTLNKGRSWIFVNAEANADGKQYGTKEHPYTNIAAAAQSVLDEQEGKVFLQSDISLTETVAIGSDIAKNVTILDDGIAARVISHATDIEWTANVPMFTVGAGSTLSFASTSTDDASPMLTLDGSNTSVTSRLVHIPTDVTVNIGKGVKVSNYKNTTLTGGVFDVTGGTLAISGGVFDGNEAGYGGVISALNGTVTITGGTFKNNKTIGSKTDGGVLIVPKNSPTTLQLKIENATFVLNSAVDCGGALAVLDSKIEATIKGCTFDSCSAASGGAIDYRSTKPDSFLNITDNTFEENSASTKGGAIFIAFADQNVSLKDNTFTDNAANQGGKDLASFTADTEITLSGENSLDAYFDNLPLLKLADDFNTSSKITLSYAKLPTVDTAIVTCSNSEQATQSMNSFSISGGRLEASEHNLVFKQGVAQIGETIYNSLAEAIETAPAADNTEIKVLSNIVLNEPITTPEGSNITIKDDGRMTWRITHSANWASDTPMFTVGAGGTLSFASTGTDKSPMLILDGSNTSKSSRLVNVTTGITVNIGTGVKVFGYNNAKSGGVFDVTGGTLSITGGVFDGNKANYGGVIAAGVGTVSITGGTFKNNKATGKDGGVIIVYLDSSILQLEMKNATFFSNIAANVGGTLSVVNRPIKASIEGCTFDSCTAIHNTSGAGGAIDYRSGWPTSSLNIAGNKFKNNDAGALGGAISLVNAVYNVTLNNNEFTENSCVGGKDLSVYNDSKSTSTITDITFDGKNSLDVYLTAKRYGQVMLKAAQTFDTSSKITLSYATLPAVDTVIVTCADASVATKSLGCFTLKEGRVEASESNLLFKQGVAQIGETTYNSLAEAVDSASATDSTEIKVLTNIMLSSPITTPDGSNITIKDDAKAAWTISHANGIEWAAEAPMFIVGAGGTLSFASTGTDKSPMLILDGSNTSKSSRLVNVTTGITVNIGTGVKVFGYNNAKSGGVFDVTGGTLSITGGVFDGNKANYGGVIAAGVGTVSITGGTFKNNKATGKDGGVIIVYLDSSILQLEMKNATFFSNIAANVGGTLSVVNRPIKASIEGCTFDSCTAIHNTSGAGGAIDYRSGWPTSSLNIAGNKFKNNDAGALGGAISLVNAVYNVTLNNNEFTENSCVGGKDLSVYNDSKSTSTITDITFDGKNSLDVYLTAKRYGQVMLKAAQTFDTSSKITLSYATLPAVDTVLVTCTDASKATEYLNSFTLVGADDYEIGVSEEAKLILKKK